MDEFEKKLNKSDEKLTQNMQILLFISKKLDTLSTSHVSSSNEAGLDQDQMTAGGW